MTRYTGRLVEVCCAAALLAGVGGCGRAPAPTDAGSPDGGGAACAAAASIPAVCDGSTDLRLLVTSMTQATRLNPGDRVLFENGSYILVDGQCHYWVMSAALEWAELRTGTLGPDEAASLFQDLHFGCWHDLQGGYPAGPGTFDADDILFTDGTNRVLCEGGCGGASVPTVVAEMRDANRSWNQRLWQEGTAVGGDMRGVIYETDRPDPEHYDWSAWPVTNMTIADIAVHTPLDVANLDYGDGVLFTADTDALRQVRQEYTSGAHGPWSHYDFLPIVDGTGTHYYELYVRDTSPFENARGLLDWIEP